MFKTNFGPNLNLIHGPNGSGKSAILSAIILGNAQYQINSMIAVSTFQYV